MAIAAQHPSADGLLDFLVSERARAMLPRESRRFSREDVRSVIESLLQEPPPSLGMPSELVRLGLVANAPLTSSLVLPSASGLT
ncbi:Os10g0365632 [Oryza sativa Japonica Group]|uniref:Os10g0365632 protein n=2 Tax=Oryza TaxID=4527 RepID=A0A0P0XTA3_ORYSJ|nr:Os10g0365632 [Oryza sativa Japonica Group]